MAVLEGGIFSRPRGKTGGLVFGAARTRTGKLVTSRLLVPPSNPNTVAQQTQRGKFQEALAIVRNLGATIYQDDWNRAISQLPGFQSLMSIFLDAQDSSKVISAPPTVNLGTLHYPDTGPTLSDAGSQIVEVDFSTELGSNGTVSDIAVALAVALDPAATPQARVVASVYDRTRNDPAAEIDVGAAGDYLVGLYFRGAGTAEGLLSLCKWDTVTIA
jgi:hypothetical protein